MALNRFIPFFSHILDMIFPPVCILCGENSLFGRGPICLECWTKARPIEGPVCKKCGMPISSPDRAGPEFPYLCSICRLKEWEFDIARAGFFFEGPVRDAIHMMKYQGHFRSGAWLGHKLVEVLEGCNYNKGNKEETLIVPVPLSPDRLRDREFNQSLFLAGPVSKSLGVSVCPSLLDRTQGAKPQVGLTPKERWSNVRGAFKVKRPELVKEKRIILVDDVFTTGATVHECARMLKKAGAIRVEVLTLARAV